MVTVRAMLSRWFVRLGARTLIVGEIASAVLLAKSCASAVAATGSTSGTGEPGGDGGTGGEGGSGAAGSPETGGSGAAGGSDGGSAGSTSSGLAGGGSGPGTGGSGVGGTGTGGTCEPNGSTCENAPQGSCAPADDGCGTVLDCSESCGTAPPAGDMTCNRGACECAPFPLPNAEADLQCQMKNGGVARRCVGLAAPNKAPANCQLLAGVTWCCVEPL